MPTTHPPRALRLAPLAAALLLACAAHAQGARQRIDLASAPLDRAVAALAQQAGVQVFLSSELAQGRTAPALQGEFTAREALERLVAGSGLVVRAQDEKTFTLEPAPPIPAAQGATLPEVTVTAAAVRPGDPPQAYAGGQVARGGRVGLLGNKDFMETPFSTISYTEEAVVSRQSGSVFDVVAQTDPSVNLQGSAQNSGSYASYAMRGFAEGGGEQGFNGLYGLGTYDNSFTAAFAERVEVLKGPSALLNGMLPGGSVGGAVNVVTKKAGDTPLTRLTAGYESDSIWKAHLDMGRRFGQDNEWGVRFNAIQEKGDTAKEHVNRNNRAFALALDYRGDNVRLSADIFNYKTHLGGNTTSFGLAPTATEIPAPPTHGKLIGGEPWSYSDYDNVGGMFKAEFDLSEKTNAWISAGYSAMDWDLVAPFSWSGLDAAGNYTANRAQRINYKVRQQAADAGLRHEFQTGSIKHQVAVNANMSTRKRYDMAGGWRQIVPFSYTSNIYDPSYSARPGNIPTASGPYTKTQEDKLQSFGIADTLHFLDDAVQLTLGVRHQSVEQVFSDYKKSVTTPAVGLLIKLNERVSLYGNYIEGLSAGSTAPDDAANAGQVFPPYQTKQMEAGVKVDWGAFTTTLAAFQIKRPSDYLDPVTNIFSVGSEQRNRGLEFNVFGEPQRGLRLMGGLAWTQGKLTKTEGGVNQGNTAPEVPKFVAKLGIEYDIAAVPGLTLTANAIHTGKQYIDQTNRLSVPSWRRYDLGARYATRVGGKPVTLRANVFNVANKAYWMGALYRGASDPRTFVLSASVDF